MNFYITSDQHFLHDKISTYCSRPFTPDMDGSLQAICLMGKNYNHIVKEQDLVFHLGDIACGPTKTYENIGHILENLNGRKILIKGNHDRWPDDYYKQYFESVQDYLIFGKYFFCHYPCYTGFTEFPLPKKEKKLIKILKQTECTHVIHGHIHNKNPAVWGYDGYKRTNVSVDYNVNNYFPFRIYDPELIKILEDLYK